MMTTTKTEAEQILSLELENVNAIGVRIRQIAADLQAQDAKQQPQYLGMLQNIDRLETLAKMLSTLIRPLRAEVRAVNEEA